MDSGWLAFLELFVVIAFAVGWGILELMLLRRDRKRARTVKHTEQNKNQTPPAF
jgi:hypothetical protein